MTAGGLVSAQAIGLRARAIDVGWSRLAAACVARKVIYDREPVGDERMVISFGESLGLAMAIGIPIPDNTTPTPTYRQAAEAIVAFGRDQFVGLVEALEDMRRIGVYKLDQR